jgi:anhydro-N-acetylmuramic acid kinase
MKKLVPGRIADRITLGIMSGTSLDGVDLSLIRFRNNYTVHESVHGYHKFPPRLRQTLLELASSDNVSKEALMLADKRLGEFYATSCVRFLKSHGIKTGSVNLVGCHGQTIFHKAPRPGKKSNVTLQIGMPDFLAQRLGCPVVSDFRTADVAANGMGAPLAPIAHFHLFQSARKSRMIVNIGGISNITYLLAAGNRLDIFATDCGPGNMLIDSLARMLFDKEYDRNGKIASSGERVPELEAYLKRSPFLRRKPPFSLGREQFGAEYLKDVLTFARKHKISDRDLLRTLSRFTCWCIKRMGVRFEKIDEVLVCGGGARNIFLMDTLREMLPESDITTTKELGVDPDFVESTVFALLANLAVDRTPGNLIGVTGARSNVVLGKITLV